MKIFVSGSSASLNELGNNYATIMLELKKLDHEVVTLYDHLNLSLSEILLKSEEDHLRMFKKFRRIVSTVDAAVMEISLPGTINMGVVITALAESGKPTVCVYMKGRRPVFVDALYSNKLILLEYTETTLQNVLKDGLDKIEDLMFRRFTLVIPGDIDAHLDKLNKQGINRSEYIRDLIRKDMVKK